MDKELIREIRQAIKQGNIDAVKSILEENPDMLDVETPFGTWLQMASAQGKIDIVKYLLERGIDVNKCTGVTDGGAIKDAAFKGHLDIVKLLIQNGAVLDVSTAEKNPLFAAIYNGHFDVVKLLVENGIDITAAYPIGELESCDAYEFARQYGQTEIADYLKVIDTKAVKERIK